jgi:hypothetical protein
LSHRFFQNNQEYLVVGGTLALGDSNFTGVAEFDLVNSTWTALGSDSDFPGPVTALEVNDGNQSSVFVAGR